MVLRAVGSVGALREASRKSSQHPQARGGLNEINECKATAGQSILCVVWTQGWHTIPTAGTSGAPDIETRTSPEDIRAVGEAADSTNAVNGGRQADGYTISLPADSLHFFLEHWVRSWWESINIYNLQSRYVRAIYRYNKRCR